MSLDIYLERFPNFFFLCRLMTFEPQEGLPAVSDLRQGFLPQKIVQPRVERYELLSENPFYRKHIM